jgi:hypothetical protein
MKHAGRIVVVSFALWFLGIGCQGKGAWTDADILLVNGNVVTVDEAFSTAEALAIKFGRIIAVRFYPVSRIRISTS